MNPAATRLVTSGAHSAQQAGSDRENRHINAPSGSSKTKDAVRRHRAASAVLGLFVSLIAAALVLPHPVREWTVRVLVLLWAGAGLVFGAAMALPVCRGIRRPIGARRRLSLHKVRSALGVLRRAVVSLPDRLVYQPLAWLIATFGGVVFSLVAFAVIPAALAVAILSWLVLAPWVIRLFGLFLETTREVQKYASLSGLAFFVGVYVGIGVLICGSLGWPAPSTSFFATAAQIDATLLVAVSVVIAAPSAWRGTPQDHFAFVAGGILMAALGLGAAIAGAVSDRAGEVLLALAVSPVLPVLMALLVGAYGRLQEIETRHERG